MTTCDSKSIGKGVDARGELGEVVAELGAELAPAVRSSVLARLGAAHRRLVGLSIAEAGLVNELLGAPRADQVSWQVPRLDDEVNDLGGLSRVGSFLFDR